MVKVKARKEKGNKGYWATGQGEGNKGGYNYNSYGSPGKGLGKGFIYMDDDWFDAWGSDNYYEYYSGDWYGQDA